MPSGDIHRNTNKSINKAFLNCFRHVAIKITRRLTL